MRDLRLLEPECLLGRSDAVAGGGKTVLRGPVRALELGRPRLLGGEMRLRSGDALRRLLPTALPQRRRLAELGAIALPLLDVGGERAPARFEPLARLGHEAKLRLQPRDF